MKKNNNVFFNKIILNDHIYFESELLKQMIPKYVRLKDIIFYKMPRFIEVKNLKIDTVINIFNEKKFYKKNMKNHSSIEPIFIQYPKILETYYLKKNIKFKDVSNFSSEDIINKEKFDILKILLNLQKDEIKSLEIFC